MKPTKVIRSGSRFPRITCALRILLLGRPTAYGVTFSMRSAVNELLADRDVRVDRCVFSWPKHERTTEWEE